jgi:hypothetical protein
MPLLGPTETRVNHRDAQAAGRKVVVKLLRGLNGIVDQLPVAGLCLIRVPAQQVLGGRSRLTRFE